MVASSLIVILPIGILCVAFHCLSLCFFVLVDMLTSKSHPSDEYTLPFEGVSEDWKSLKRYAQSVIGAIMLIYHDPTERP